MLRKPFNRELGETRQCKQCDSTFHAMRPIWTCCKCQNENQKEIQYKKRRDNGLKNAYPFNNKELYGNHGATKRFTQIRRRLNECTTREELTKHYDAQLKEIEENGILKWIWDRRDNGTIKANKKKSKAMTQRDWPDTRGWYED